MTMRAHPALDGDLFQSARDTFEAIVRWLRSGDVPMDHTALEEGLDERRKEVLRLLYQARLDELSKVERSEAARAAAPEGTTIRKHSRQLETSFGRVRFCRHGHKVAGQQTRYPLDERLGLPLEVYTHPVQRRVAEQAQASSWDRVIDQVDETTGAHVPKRQAEQIARKATKDFEAFYAQCPANDSLGAGALLVASSDAKGVRMLPKALREATRKAAEAEKAAAVRGDPMATKKPRLHDKRMAVITAVWEQEPRPRAATDIAAELGRDPGLPTARKARLPRPHNKRVSASVEKDLATGVGEMFDEMDRRDPERLRRAVVLIDGAESQQTAILDRGRRHERTLTIVLDLIHVIHYLWHAGFALCRGDRAATDAWVAQHLHLLLSHPVDELIATIQQAAAARRFSKTASRPIHTALRYFRRNASFMDYPTFLATGLPIATGVIEGACRHLIQDRLGITGARWDLPGAEAMLRMRALHASGDWDAYWRFHLRQEALRNYPSATAAA